jgi:excisionase family DNA binding protein
MKEFPQRKWGTPQPILVSNPGMGLGVMLLQGFGTYSFEVKDPQQLVTQIVGKTASYSIDQIEDRLRSILLSQLQDTLNEWGAKLNLPQLLAKTQEMAGFIRSQCEDDFEAVGLSLKSFILANLRPSDKSAQELRDMGMLDMSTYTQLQAADAMRDAANNQGGGAGLTAGIGAGMGIGNLMGQALQGGMQSGQQQPKAPNGGAPAAGGGMSDVMTPSEAAAALKVTEEDVMAAINDGSLKAKKLGNAYRISRESLEEFLKS